MAKTLAVRSFATVVGGDFARIQFTPDLVPSDIVGTRIYKASTEGFDVELGPVFVNFILADEINRAPAKVQAAMLELMAEKQVSIGGRTYPMPAAVHRDRHPEPDRVRRRVSVTGGPAGPLPAEGRRAVPAGQRGVRDPAPDECGPADRLSPCSIPQRILQLQRLADDVFVHNLVAEYIVRLVLATRTPAEFNLR